MSFTTRPLSVTVELWIDGAWLDVTHLDDDFYLLGDESEAIYITRGRRDETDRPQPTSARLAFRDADGRLNGDNAESPWYGKVGRNTRCRISVAGVVRMVGEIATLRPEWDVTARYMRVDVEVEGLLRRLQQGQRPLKSAATRALTAAANDTERVAYWPLEEESDATMVYSPYGGTVSYAGTINFGALESMASARLLTFGSSDALLFFSLPTWTDSLGQHMVMATFRFPETELTNGALIYRLYFVGGDVDFIDLQYQTGGLLALLVYYGGALIDTVAGSNWADYILDREVSLWITTEQSGADVNFRLRGTTSINWTVEFSDTLTSRTLGRLFAVTVGQSNVEGLGYGQLIVGNNKDSFGNYVDDLDFGSGTVVTGARGYLGERSASRFLRLCEEEGVTASVVGTEDDSARMGTQGSGLLLDLLYECVDVDGGVLRESRDALGLEYRTRADLYNQTAAVSLTYASGHVSPPFLPVGDDQQVRNDVTATRRGGGSARHVIPDGDIDHLTTESPDDNPAGGVGVYEEELTLNAHTDDDLDGIAAWFAHVRSWREQRFPDVALELARDVYAADAGLTANVRDADSGDLIVIDTTGAPAWVPPDEVDLLVQGYEETIGQVRHTFKFNATPGRVWQVAIVGAAAGSTDLLGQAVDAAASTLAAGINTTATALSVASTGPVWTTTSTDWNTGLHGTAGLGGGLFLDVGGEVMRVTSISGASSPQTVNVVRSVNGVVKSHSSGAAVHIKYPAVVGL